MKAIIDIITEKIETGNHDINLSNYKTHTENNLPVANWIGDAPNIGDVLTNGQQDMTVISYIVIGDSVGIEMDNGMKVDSHQLIEMMTNKICWVK